MRLSLVILAACLCSTVAFAEPKWDFQGDDADVLARVKDSYSVVMGTIVGSELQNVKVPFATVVLTVLPIDNFAGIPIKEKFTVSFPIDSLPEDNEKREVFILERSKKDIGKLMVFFLAEAPSAPNVFRCEWLDFREYSPDFFRLIDSNRRK
jgi:hypothetical protein